MPTGVESYQATGKPIEDGCLRATLRREERLATQ